MDALGAELLLQFGPPFGDGLSISPLECGSNLNPSIATPKIDAQLGTGIGPKDGTSMLSAIAEEEPPHPRVDPTGG